ncbi:Protein CBG27861 [Caenorhabditis briggsae]|nr:Protein CBG27861 [Caenorhabditis briggsae]CAR98286.1 Protein CBG27861 [Caenorhabditis briggsae]
MSCTMSCFGKLIVCLNPNASKGKEYIRWVIFITKEFTNTIRVVIVRYWDRKY